jgi:hypothetical protein
MRLTLRLVGVTIIFGTNVPSALAEHAKIQLDVTGRRDQVTAYVDQTPPEWGKNPRPDLKVRSHEPVKVQFLLTNIYPHKTLENVVVHFFVVREEKAGQKEIPDLKGEVILESAFDLDLKPGGKVGQRTTLRISEPGAYLVRIETRNTQSDHEHFAAIDLIVIGEEKP